MNYRIALVGAIIFSSSVSVHAQSQWYQWPFGGWEQPQYQRSEPRRERRSYTRHYHHSESKRHDADDSRSKPRPQPQPKPKVEYRTRTVVKTWNDMSQDKARDWIREEVQGFCGKFPKDVACQRPKEE